MEKKVDADSEDSQETLDLTIKNEIIKQNISRTRAEKIITKAQQKSWVQRKKQKETALDSNLNKALHAVKNCNGHTETEIRHFVSEILEYLDKKKRNRVPFGVLCRHFLMYGLAPNEKFLTLLAG